MRYHDYMSQFTVIDQTKSVLLSRMKQRAKQLRAARMEQTQTAAVALKKRSTFRMSPMRWVAIAVSAALVVAAVPTVYFTAFHEKEDVFHAINSIKMEYMDNMMVDVDGVTAYSIKSEETGDTDVPLRLQAKESKDPAISLFSATIMEDKAGVQPYAEKKNARNYLYSTNESYEAGNVEYDDSGITRVTFKKNSEVTEDVYDNNGELIDSNRKITQEEMDGQINKIYTTKEYTFIQFVPMVEKSGWYNYKAADGKTKAEYVFLRPESLKYDENGVADFDKAVRTYEDHHGLTTSEMAAMSYYSSSLSASFVIDNATGYIYKIDDDFRIDGFQNGLVKMYGPSEWGGIDYVRPLNVTYYTLSTDDNHNLVFTDILPNKDIEINNVFVDKYGWLYVVNNRVDDVDRERKIIYMSDEKYKYVYDADKNVYMTNGKYRAQNNNYFDHGVDNKPALTKQMIDGVEVALAPDSIIGNLKYIWRDYYDDETGNISMLTGKYQKLSVWLMPMQRYNEKRDEMGSFVNGYNDYIVAYDEATDSGLVISEDYMEKVSSDLPKIRWLDSNYDILLSIRNKKLSFAKVDLSECLTETKTLETENFESLRSDLDLYEAEDYYLSVGQDEYKINDVYYASWLNETKYYHVVRTDTGVTLEELTSKSYSDTVFIFQPINK